MSSSSLPWHSSSTIRYTLHDATALSGHKLELRLNFFARLLSHSPSATEPRPRILRQTPFTPTPPSHFSFPLDLLRENHFLCKYKVFHFLSIFNLSFSDSYVLANKIMLRATPYTSRDSVFVTPFRVVADVDYIQNLWVDDDPAHYDNTTNHINLDLNFSLIDETVILSNENFPTTSRAAASKATKSGIERLKKKRKFVNLGDDELGNCVICHEELCCSTDNKEVIQMHCNHLFHESCIVQWLKKSNSCPLCRSPATKIEIFSK